VRGTHLGTVFILGVLAGGSWLTPWWIFPDSERWHLSMRSDPYATSCVEIGDTLRLSAARRRNGFAPEYESTDVGARVLSRFRWSVLPPSDSFWTSQRTPLDGWWGEATIDRDGTLVGRREGVVAAEVREGGHRAVHAYAVLGPPSRETTDTASHSARLRKRCVGLPVKILTDPER
jgi:hypothetical protein